jgi:hypothetical protein
MGADGSLRFIAASSSSTNDSLGNGTYQMGDWILLHALYQVTPNPNSLCDVVKAECSISDYQYDTADKS